ncbi:MAG: flagellar biosynthesis regulator FlaF [Rhodobacteraceae bacterium]|jgi:flagellar protein FlaF|nr:flagellar biosynthesis regulator FlaF [Paracoccaceae bacterium]
MAKTAYSNPGQPTRTPRTTEYEAFARITHRLKAAAALDKSGFSSLVRALHENRELWTILAADVAGSGNGLPPQLRAQIIYLYEFTMQHTSKVLAGDARPDVLIDINTAVMRGLRQGGPA